MNWCSGVRFASSMAVFALVGPALASVPLEIPIQGTVRDNAGVTVQSGAFEMTFALYGDAEAEAPLWTEVRASVDGDCAVSPKGCVTIHHGIFRVELGKTTPLSSNLFSDHAGLWLGIAVEAEPELPRRPLGSSPFALHAETAGGLACSGCLEVTHLSDEAREALDAGAVEAVTEALPSLADGDDDALEGLDCQVGQSPVWSADGWACGSTTPSGMIGFFAGSCPPNWIELTAFGGRAVVIAPTGGAAGTDGTVGAPLTDLGSRTITEVPAHSHYVKEHLHDFTVIIEGTTSSEGDHLHVADPTAVTSSAAQAGGASGCTTLYDKWNNSGGCGHSANCSSTSSAAACGSGGGAAHSHSVDVEPFDTSIAGSHTHTFSTAVAAQTSLDGQGYSEPAGEPTVDVTMPYVQLRACQAP